jgi:hypothetical protein
MFSDLCPQEGDKSIAFSCTKSHEVAVSHFPDHPESAPKKASTIMVTLTSNITAFQSWASLGSLQCEAPQRRLPSAAPHPVVPALPFLPVTTYQSPTSPPPGLAEPLSAAT